MANKIHDVGHSALGQEFDDGYLRHSRDFFAVENKAMDGAIIPDDGGAVLGWKHLEHVAWNVQQGGILRH